MYPRCFSGDVLIVDPEARCESGDKAIVRINDEVVFKVVYFEDGKIILSSINKKYGSTTYDKDSGADMSIVGKVVEILGRG